MPTKVYRKTLFFTPLLKTIGKNIFKVLANAHSMFP